MGACSSQQEVFALNDLAVAMSGMTGMPSLDLQRLMASMPVATNYKCVVTATRTSCKLSHEWVKHQDWPLLMHLEARRIPIEAKIALSRQQIRWIKRGLTRMGYDERLKILFPEN